MRKKRRDSFFGIHFDFHAMPGDVVPRIYQPEIIEQLLDSVKPDYVQCDTKGHAGLSSYPTNFGTRADDIKKDILRMWRTLTVKRDIALYAHYSGLYDMRAAKDYPEWAVMDENGNVSSEYMSPFSPYADEVLIPQLFELSNEYKLDGVWVDGECWAAMVDYSKYARDAYYIKTGKSAPKSHEEGYESYREFCREGFKNYVQYYINVLKEANPFFQITSNWIYSAYMPEEPKVSVDFLSGDYSPSNSVISARHNGRCLSNRNIPWDLMAWGQSALPCSWTTRNRNTKELNQYCQEASVIIALGGGFQFFNIQYGGGGTIQQWAIPMWEKVAEFVRKREEICFKSKPISQIAIIYPNEKSNRNTPVLYTMEYEGFKSVCTWIDAVQDIQLSSVVLMEYQLEDINEYDIIIVPDTEYLSHESVLKLKEYIKSGGNLIADLKSAGYFSDIIGAENSSCIKENLIFLNGGGTLAAIETSLINYSVTSATPSGYYYLDNYFEENSYEAALITSYGKGKILNMCFDFSKSYDKNKSTAIRNFLKHQFKHLEFTPKVEVSGSSYVDVTLAKKDKKLLINLINFAGSHNIPTVRSYSDIPPIGPLKIKIKTAKKPTEVYIEPEHKTCKFTYKDNIITIRINKLHLHTIISIKE